ncbi:MAG: YdjY domain-containing protein [Phycisphaeraceae bacterium]
MKQRSLVSAFLITACVFALAPFTRALAEDAKKSPMTVDAAKKTLRITCRIAPRKLPDLSEIYPIEVIACATTAAKMQKAHETIVLIDHLKPSEIHKALESFGLKAGKPAKGNDAAAEGPELKVSLELPGPANTVKKTPIEKCLVDRKTGKSLPSIKWHFTGSKMAQPDPNKDEKVYGADLTGTLISIFPVTDETVMQTSLTMKEEPLIKLDTNTKLLPAEGTIVTLIIEVK